VHRRVRDEKGAARMPERNEHMPGLVPERDGYIPGVPCAVDTSHPDPEAAIGFYGGLFGWEFEDVMPPESKRRYFVARLRGLDVAAVGSIPEGAPPTAMWNTYFWVDSADETASKVSDAGGGVVAEPVDVPPDAGRTAVFTDPEGAAFRVWQAKENKGAQLVNEPGSWNLNGLNTRDVEDAKSFLWLGVRLANDHRGRRGRNVDPARLRRLSRARQPRAPQADGGGGRTEGV